MTTQKPELMPCPFCGGEAKFNWAGKVGCTVGSVDAQKCNLIWCMPLEQWNTRAHDAGLVKALEDGLSELSCTCDERFMLDTECPVCRMTKALAAHKASAHGGKEGR